MYILREINEDETRNEYHCKTYEDARKLLDTKAEYDKSRMINNICEIKHGEERYTRVSNESKWYILSIWRVEI